MNRKIFTPSEFILDNAFNVINSIELPQNSIPCNLFYDDNGHYLELHVPGFSKDEISIETKKRTVIISGKISETKSTRNVNYRGFSLVKNFEKSHKLHEDVDVELVSAKLENGILTVTMPFSEKIKNSMRKVDIE